MSVPTLPGMAPATTVAKPRRTRRARQANSLLAQGEPSIWLTGGALAVALLMIGGLLLLVVIQGGATFWPRPLVEIRTVAGKTYLGEVTRQESYQPAAEVFDALPEEVRDKARQDVANSGGSVRRRLLRIGNRELTGINHIWISDFEVAEESGPEWGLVIERLAWGNFYGTPAAFLVDGKTVASTPEDVWSEFNQYHGQVLEWQRDQPLNAEGAAPGKEKARFQLIVRTADGQEKTLPLDQIVRAYPANQLTTWDKFCIYTSRWREYLTDRPRESNTEGGVFPAIWGTVAMTLLMCLVVVPFGVLAALYLREYAKSGPIISAIRIAINNLAGVPSIVFGVFGYGFFCLLVGAYIDGGPQRIDVQAWPAGNWWLGMFLTAIVGLAAFVAGLVGGSRFTKQARLGRCLRGGGVLLWLLCLGAFVYLLVHSPFFHGLYQSRLPTPTFGSGGVLWAALTLALLTLPVVIVATEEALAAVPNSMREGSYACGASKWQTIRRIVLPRALPGIMTGMILAMARGAGEVAPLMLVGAIKWAPVLPAIYPLEGLSRRFMHLGFHIYDVGFQSVDSESARPMVFTTTLLLIAIVALLNVTAIWLRSRLRRRYLVSQF
jgi:ABC-type phosphate transport system permease subunit